MVSARYPQRSRLASRAYLPPSQISALSLYLFVFAPPPDAWLSAVMAVSESM